MCSVKPQNDLSHKGQAVEEWADLHFFRPIGIRIARALQPTGISADHVTLWPLVVGLVAAAGLAHTFQSAAIDFVRNAFLYIGVGNGGELDLPEDLAGGPQTTVLQRFGARVYRDYVQRQSHLFPRTVKLIRLLRRHGV